VPFTVPDEPPTIWPASLMSLATLRAASGKMPRSVMTPFCHRKAWLCPLTAVEDVPTTCPDAFTADALLDVYVAPSVPRSMTL